MSTNLIIVLETPKTLLSIISRIRSGRQDDLMVGMLVEGVSDIVKERVYNTCSPGVLTLDDISKIVGSGIPVGTNDLLELTPWLENFIQVYTVAVSKRNCVDINVYVDHSTASCIYIVGFYQDLDI